MSTNDDRECNLWLYEGHTAGLVSMGPRDTMLRFLNQSCANGRYVLEGTDDEATVFMKTDDGLQIFPLMAPILGWHNAKRRMLNEEEREKVIAD